MLNVMAPVQPPSPAFLATPLCQFKYGFKVCHNLLIEIISSLYRTVQLVSYKCLDLKQIYECVINRFFADSSVIVTSRQFFGAPIVCDAGSVSWKRIQPLPVFVFLSVNIFVVPPRVKFFLICQYQCRIHNTSSTTNLRMDQMSHSIYSTSFSTELMNGPKSSSICILKTSLSTNLRIGQISYSICIHNTWFSTELTNGPNKLEYLSLATFSSLV